MSQTELLAAILNELQAIRLALKPAKIEGSPGAVLLTEIFRVTHGAMFSVADLILEAEDSENSALAVALLDTCEVVSSRHLGAWFRANEGAAHGGLSVHRASGRKSDGLRWKVVRNDS